MENKYEWQWVYLYTPKLGTPKYLITEKHHSKKEEVANLYYSSSNIKKYKPSRKLKG